MQFAQSDQADLVSQRVIRGKSGCPTDQKVFSDSKCGLAIPMGV